MQNPVITIEMENGDVMKAELYPEVAPNTVNNFLSLVNKGFYDGLIFHHDPGWLPAGNRHGRPGLQYQGRVLPQRFPE